MSRRRRALRGISPVLSAERRSEFMTQDLECTLDDGNTSKLSNFNLEKQPEARLEIARIT